MPYRKEILKAVEALRDNHMRSSIDAIYRHVESNLPDGVECNYPLFLHNLKSMAEDGDLELTSTHVGLSQEFMKRRLSEIYARGSMLQAGLHTNVTLLAYYTPSQRSVDHLKNKEAKRRVLSRYSW